ncbi:MAG: CorA family divalent cation transporter [Bdellovibrionota bacterium]
MKRCDKSLFDDEEIEKIQAFLGKAVYIDDDSLKMLSLRSAEFTQDGMQSSSLGFLFKDKKVYHLQDVDKIFEIEIEDFFSLVKQNGEYLRNILISFAEQIDDLEDWLFDRKTPRHFLNTWFRFRKDLASIDRAFSRNSIVLTQLASVPDLILEEFDDELTNLISHLDSDRRNCITELSRLEAIFNHYNSLRSEKMNGNVYWLALISGVFLPLNLIVGFFGINTENLFFKDNPNGTLYVLWIIVAVFGVLLIGLPLLKLIDQTFFRKLLWRYNAYKSIHRRIHAVKFRIDED